MYCLTILEAGSLKLRCQQGSIPTKGFSVDSFPAFSSVGLRCSCVCINSWVHSNLCLHLHMVFASFLCLHIFSVFLIRTIVIGFRVHQEDPIWGSKPGSIYRDPFSKQDHIQGSKGENVDISFQGPPLNLYCFITSNFTLGVYKLFHKNNLLSSY